MTKQRSNGGSVLVWPWDRPATTIMCDERLPAPGTHTTNWQSANAIRLSQLAGTVLQGFPPDWQFCGRSKARRWNQIGQAVPPALAAAVAGSIHSWFASDTQPDRRPLVPRTLADLLVTAAPELADVAKLDAFLAPLTTSERLATEHWARAKVSSRGDTPSMPECVASLYRRIPPQPTQEPSCS